MDDPDVDPENGAAPEDGAAAPEDGRPDGPGAGSEEGDVGEAAPGGGPHPFDPASPLLEHWEDLMEDVAATADIYREEGWEVLELHPGDVTALDDPDEFGLDVLVPDDQFERLESWVAEGRFGEFEVYRAESGMVFLLVVTRDETHRRAVCLPAYYGFEAVPGLAARAEREGRFLTHVRRLDGERVTFTHDDPAPFFPGGGPGSDPDDGGADGARGDEPGA
jgi:hypothetical protein